MEMMYVFEAIMMICFGASWPISICKTIKVKFPAGKSLIFLWLILIGYIAGIIFKISQPGGRWVIVFYALNAVMVAIDLFFTSKYMKNVVAARQKQADC